MAPLTALLIASISMNLSNGLVLKLDAVLDLIQTEVFASSRHCEVINFDKEMYEIVGSNNDYHPKVNLDIDSLLATTERGMIKYCDMGNKDILFQDSGANSIYKTATA